MEESKDCNIDIDVDVLVRRMKENIWRRRISFFWRKRKPEEKGGNIWKRYLKDIEKSQFRFQSRDFCQFSEGFGIGFQEFGLGKKVSVLVLENLVLEKKYLFRFRRIWSRKKSIGFGKFGLEKKVSVSVSVKILVSSFSDLSKH